MSTNLRKPAYFEAAGQRRRPPLASIVAGAATFVIVVVIGVMLVMARPSQWAAADSVVVLPRQTGSPETMAGYYDTLSRGQIVATFAEILRQQRFQEVVTRQMGLSPAQANRFDVAVEVVPDTAMISTAVTGPNPSQVEELADGISRMAIDFFAGLRSPYTAIRVSPARDTAERTGAGRESLLAVTAVAGLAAGLAMQQAVHQIALALARRPGPAEPVIPAQDRLARRWRA
jgi:capsular polysaccharide biosynthesis protein